MNMNEWTTGTELKCAKHCSHLDEQDADVIWMMMRPAFYFDPSASTKVGNLELSNQDLCLIDQVKMRSGSTGVIPLRFDGALMRLRNYE